MHPLFKKNYVHNVPKTVMFSNITLQNGRLANKPQTEQKTGFNGFKAGQQKR
jgi:hypothetical protein